MDTVRAAVHNNAQWCDLVCRRRGLATDHSSSYWSTSEQPPPFYPSAVTLEPALTQPQVDEMLARSGAGAVKDSYADLDLASRDYQILFSAQWISCTPPQAARTIPPGWSSVQSPDELERWSVAHGSVGVFQGLLDERSVRFVAMREEGRIVAGGIAHHTAEVVGISNVFGDQASAATRWSALVRVAGACFPGLPLVGYQRGDELAGAEAAGFRPLAPLRVWGRRPA